MTNNKETYADVKLSPLGDRVLILPDVKEEVTTKSGFVVPDNTDNLSGVVIAVGPGKVLDNGNFSPINITYGSRVLIGKYGHEEVVFDGKKYYLAPESSILAIVG